LKNGFTAHEDVAEIVGDNDEVAPMERVGETVGLDDAFVLGEAVRDLDLDGDDVMKDERVGVARAVDDDVADGDGNSKVVLDGDGDAKVVVDGDGDAIVVSVTPNIVIFSEHRLNKYGRG
jgi:hypothetical protein